MSNKKIISIADEVMQLKFFASRFGVKNKKINFVLLRMSNEDGEVDVKPAIYIGDNLYIDILEDKISSLVNLAGCICTYANAEIKKYDGIYVFHNKYGAYEIPAKLIYERYKDKFVHNELIMEAACLN